MQIVILILAGIGLINGLTLGAFFLLGTSPLKKHHVFLSLFLIAITVRIAKPIVFYFEPALLIINLYLTIGLMTSILIGPLLFQYVYHYLGKAPDRSYWKQHMLLNLALMGALICIYPIWEDRDIWGDKLIYIVHIQRIAYLVATGILIHQFCGLFIPKEVEVKKAARWLRLLLLGKVLIFLGYVVTYSGYGSIIKVFVIFSFFLYVLIFLLIQSSNSRNEIILLPSLKYGGRQIKEKITARILEKLNQLLITEEIYKIPDLKVKDVAGQLNISPHQLSQIINQQLQKNFKLFINEYRVEKAKYLIQHNHHFTLEAIGYECGFRSKSNFFLTFKKLTGDTPKIYKDSFLSTVKK